MNVDIRASTEDKFPEKDASILPKNDDEDREEVKESPRTLQDHSKYEYIFTVSLGMIMALIAGYSNGVCLSGFIKVDTEKVTGSVTGVTGAYTNSAIAIAVPGNPKEWEKYKLAVGTLFSVMVGSCISSVLNPRPIAFEISPSFGSTFIIGAIFSALGSVSAIHNSRREFYLVAISNGIMNGISSMYTANLIRVTHLTGTTTDIGLFVGQHLRGNRANNWKLFILSGLVTSFWLGSLIGYKIASSQQEFSLILHSAFFFVMGCSVLGYFVIEHKMSIWDALFGLGKLSSFVQRIVVTRHIHGGGEDDISIDEEVPEYELLHIYDELDEDLTGHVDQEQLLQELEKRGLQVTTVRLPTTSILKSKFNNHGDMLGDWTVARNDFQRLVHKDENDDEEGELISSNTTPKLSLPVGVYRRQAGLSPSDDLQPPFQRAESFHGASTLYRRKNGGAFASIRDLRQASIRENENDMF